MCLVVNADTGFHIVLHGSFNRRSSKGASLADVYRLETGLVPNAANTNLEFWMRDVRFPPQAPAIISALCDRSGAFYWCGMNYNRVGCL